MANKFKVIGGLSRKARFNITIVIILLFLAVAIFASVDQSRSDQEDNREEKRDHRIGRKTILA